jgi:hypothetical protein
MDKFTESLFFRWLIRPAMQFVFEFIGDRPWLAAIIVGLIALAIWKWLMPWVRGFHTLFGWKGWALLAMALVTFGAFGAGWRAHRDAFSDVREVPIEDRKPKPKPKPRNDVDYEGGGGLFPGLDDKLKDFFNPNRDR